MQKYAEICRNMSGLRKVPCYEKMQEICKHMQNMQSRIVYAAHAETCTPHFVPMICCCRMITSIISSRAAERWLAAVAQVVGVQSYYALATTSPRLLPKLQADHIELVSHCHMFH
jgi:hypothetical protein